MRKMKKSRAVLRTTTSVVYFFVLILIFYGIFNYFFINKPHTAHGKEFQSPRQKSETVTEIIM